MPAMDSEDEEYLQNADLDDPVWSKEPVLDSHEYLCIHEIPRPAIPTSQTNQGVPAIQPPHPNQGVPAMPPQQPGQVERPPDVLKLDIPESIPDLLDVPEEVISDFEAWAQSVLDYPW